MDIYSFMQILPVVTPFLTILRQCFRGFSHLGYNWLPGLYSKLMIGQIFLSIETLL